MTKKIKSFAYRKPWLLLLILGLIGLGWYAVSQRSTKVNAEAYHQSKTPTLFFHGYGSSSNAEKHMANAAQKAGASNTIIEARVDKDSRVTLKGEIGKDAVNPIVLVNYADNRNPDTKKAVLSAYHVVKALQEKYDIKDMNLVGHSFGNMSIMYYFLYYGNDESLPKVKKQVDIAGHFNGIMGYNEPSDDGLAAEGKPNEMTEQYKELLPLRESYPDQQVAVLNIYGDTGEGNDERVRNTSSQSLKYLLNNRAKSYQELKISGQDGQHSKLHETSKVDQPLIAFLWGKN